MQSVILDFGTIKVEAEPYDLIIGGRIYKVDTLDAVLLVEQMASKQLADICRRDDTVILNNKGTFLLTKKNGFFVILVAKDVTTKVLTLKDNGNKYLNAFFQCHSGKCQCPIEKLNSLPGNPSPQVLAMVSFHHRANGQWKVKDETTGLTALTVVKLIDEYTQQGLAYIISCEGFN